jgi:hypothetical protein
MDTFVTLRVSNESLRVSNESLRVSNESLRVINESMRVIPGPLGPQPFVCCLLVILPLFCLHIRSFLPLDI